MYAKQVDAAHDLVQLFQFLIMLLLLIVVNQIIRFLCVLHPIVAVVLFVEQMAMSILNVLHELTLSVAIVVEVTQKKGSGTNQIVSIGAINIINTNLRGNDQFLYTGAIQQGINTDTSARMIECSIECLFTNIELVSSKS